MSMALRTHCWHTHAVAETQALGRAIGAVAQPGLLLALNGELGAGKTALTQGIAAGLGITTKVTSPTFVIANEYPTAADIDLIHIDSYRLGEDADGAPLEAFTFGLEDIFDRNDVIIVIEWADRLAALLPADHLRITLDYVADEPNGRRIEIAAYGPQSVAILEKVSG